MPLDKSKLIVRAPHFPLYSDLRHAVSLFEGEPFDRVKDTIYQIREQTGTPQNPVDWSHPDEWISQKLKGEYQGFARKVWEKSNKALNPRHMYGCYLFINRMKLLDKSSGIYQLNERGKRFLDGEENLVRELDASEGIPKLLSLLAERSPCKRSELLPDWSDYLKAVSLFKTQSTFEDTLQWRLRNLIERRFIEREGISYTITEEGQAWLNSFKDVPKAKNMSAPIPQSDRSAVFEAAHKNKEVQLKILQSRLMKLAPFEFEHFIKTLLDKMEYEDVVVTKISGDKGVDVVARVQFGITEITEVVQVKRTESTIGRPIIDALRGALPYHKALRGTIISLGNFAKGAQDGALFPGAAPITLIDGQRLMELCAKHKVGLTSDSIEVFELDETFFSENFEQIEDSDEEI